MSEGICMINGVFCVLLEKWSRLLWLTRVYHCIHRTMSEEYSEIFNIFWYLKSSCLFEEATAKSYYPSDIRWMHEWICNTHDSSLAKSEEIGIFMLESILFTECRDRTLYLRNTLEYIIPVVSSRPVREIYRIPCISSSSTVWSPQRKYVCVRKVFFQSEEISLMTPDPMEHEYDFCIWSDMTRYMFKRIEFFIHGVSI